MKIVNLILSFIILFGAISALADDTANSCDDYFMRHYKADLKTLSMNIREVSTGTPYQEITLRLQNIGNQPFPSGAKWISVVIKGVKKRYPIAQGITAGEIINIPFSYPSHFLSACEKTQVAIDTDHNIYQHGCQVWNNDTSELMAQRASGILCSIIPLPRRPIPIPRRIP